MKRTYQSGGRSVGVVNYELGESSIVLEFADGKYRYLYNQEAPGAVHVRAMQRLAVAGQGLTTYVSQHVRERYAAKLPVDRD